MVLLYDGSYLDPRVKGLAGKSALGWLGAVATCRGESHAKMSDDAKLILGFG